MVHQLKHKLCPSCQGPMDYDGALQVCVCGFSKVNPGEFDEMEMTTNVR